MFLKDGQILVDDFSHQNFGIWTFFCWVMAILVKNIGKITKLLCKGAKYLVFFMKSAITQPKKVQIPKFWCLKSCTNIWLSFGNIHSIQKIKKIELQGKKGSKFAKIGQFLHCKKLKLQYLKNFPRFDFMDFFCDFLHMRPLIFHWKSSWYRTGVMWGMHGWRAHVSVNDIGVSGQVYRVSKTPLCVFYNKLFKI